MSLISGTSKIAIISEAFTLLGKENPIQNLDQSPTTSSASKLYDTYLLRAFSIHPWRFAMVPGAILSKLVNPPTLNRWQFAYQLPENFISLYRLHPLNYTDFNIYIDQIYTNIDSPLQIDYITKIEEQNFPSYFVTYMIQLIASLMAMQVTQNADIVSFMESKEKQELAIARNLDSQMMPNPFVQSNALWSAHSGL